MKKLFLFMSRSLLIVKALTKLTSVGLLLSCLVTTHLAAMEKPTFEPIQLVEIVNSHNLNSCYKNKANKDQIIYEQITLLNNAKPMKTNQDYKDFAQKVCSLLDKKNYSPKEEFIEINTLIQRQCLIQYFKQVKTQEKRSIHPNKFDQFMMDVCKILNEPWTIGEKCAELKKLVNENIKQSDIKPKKGLKRKAE